jgi:hypothetical protein
MAFMKTKNRQELERELRRLEKQRNKLWAELEPYRAKYEALVQVKSQIAKIESELGPLTEPRNQLAIGFIEENGFIPLPLTQDNPKKPVAKPTPKPSDEGSLFSSFLALCLVGFLLAILFS